MAIEVETVPWHLSGNWEPMQNEMSTNDLDVDGQLPKELNGLYLRVGPNPSRGWSPHWFFGCLLYTSPSPRDGLLSRMPSSA